MTHQQILWAINDAAALAARSAFDAFGNDPAADLPMPEMAWNFLDTLYTDAEIVRPAALPEFMPRQFAHDYRRHLCLIGDMHSSAVRRM